MVPIQVLGFKHLDAGEKDIIDVVVHLKSISRFRMRQVNIVGSSPPSQPSRKIQTLPAPPDIAPANVTLRTASETSLWLRWMVRRAGRVRTLTFINASLSDFQMSVGLS